MRNDATTPVDTGFELHNVLDCGDPTFDLLIDHPSWVDHARRYAGEAGTYVQGITIDEHIATIREAGGHHPVHSGGHDASIRTQYAIRNGRFRCGQLNVLVALTDIGPGDGADDDRARQPQGELPAPAGGRLRPRRPDGCTSPSPSRSTPTPATRCVFVDACMHGGSSRTTPGERRVIILRYGPPWARPRFGYTLSPEFLERLTPERRRIMDPIPTMHTGDTGVPLDLHSHLHRRP